MEDSAEGQDGDEPHLPHVVDIAPAGDLILDVTFENSKATLKAARRAAPRLSSQRATPAAALRTRLRIGFRVELETLKAKSKYFEKLLSDTRFREAKTITTALKALALKDVRPAEADIRDLPWVEIRDDDEASHYAYRDKVFADLLRILHGQDTTTTPATMDFVSSLAILADRFDCIASVSKVLTTGLKFKWPVTSRKQPTGEDAGMSRSTENVLRQKILVSWLLNQPVRFQASTKELILNGSCKWSSFAEQDEGGADEETWWYLQDGLEQELQYRRHCILNTIASVQRHFLALYTSRTRQCKLGYDSSAACDSYQLGEMLKFLTHKNLLFLIDFSPASLDSIIDASLLPLDSILSALRQCPSYQIDKNHTNCGLRIRILPILDFIEKGLLSASSVPINLMAWKNNRQTEAWLRETAEVDKDGATDRERVFRFTRAMASDQRLRFEHAMGADRFAREVFTASSWDWTAEEQDVQTAFATTPTLKSGMGRNKMRF